MAAAAIAATAVTAVSAVSTVSVSSVSTVSVSAPVPGSAGQRVRWLCPGQPVLTRCRSEGVTPASAVTGRQRSRGGGNCATGSGRASLYRLGRRRSGQRRSGDWADGGQCSRQHRRP